MNRRSLLKYVLGTLGLAAVPTIAVKASGDGQPDDEVFCAAEDCGTPITDPATPAAPAWEPPVAVEPDDEWWATITELPNTGTGSSLMGGEPVYVTEAGGLHDFIQEPAASSGPLTLEALEAALEEVWMGYRTPIFFRQR